VGKKCKYPHVKLLHNCSSVLTVVESQFDENDRSSQSQRFHNKMQGISENQNQKSRNSPKEIGNDHQFCSRGEKKGLLVVVRRYRSNPRINGRLRINRNRKGIQKVTLKVGY